MAEEQPVTRRMSEEGRQRLSQLAKQRHAEGKFGGAKYGRMGGKAKAGRGKRIAQRVAEAAAEEANSRAIIDVFKDAIHPSQPMSVRLKGAQAWAEIATQNARMEIQEAADSAAQHSREELLDLLANKLTTGPAAAIVRQRIEQQTGVVDAEVVEEVEE